MRYGLGFRADVHATHDGDAGAFLASASAAAGRPSQYLDQVGGVLDQGQTETCVGQAFKRAIDLRAAALGLSLPSSSALAIRNLALQVEQRLDGVSGQPLTDVGCQPSLAVQAIRTYGLPSEAAFPFDPAHTTDKLTLSELEDADKRVGVFVRQFRGITATGSDRIVQVRQALDAGMPVVLAVNGSTPEFQSYQGGGLLTAWTQGRTDHMVELIDFSDDGLFDLLNSWGPSWGAGGRASVDGPFVQASDHLFVVDIGATP
jgi:Papain family cysteine protease